MLKLPTDNLYKFMAISGLTLIAFGGYAALNCWTETNLAIINWNAKTHVFSERADLELEEALVQAQCAIDHSRAKAGEPEKEECKSITRRSPDSDRSGNQLTLELAALQGQKNVLEFMSQRYWVVFWFGVSFICLGLILAAVGFVLWYRRLQRYEDQAVKKVDPSQGEDNEASAAEQD